MPNPWDRPVAQKNPWDRPEDATTTTSPDTPKAAPPESTLQKIGSTALDFGKGMGEGALSTLSVADDWAAKHLPTWFTTPIGQDATPENQARSLARTKELATPANTTQKIGKGTEQVAEFLLPTGVEEGAAKFGGAAAGKAGKLLGRIGGSAVHSGAVNKAQGGSFTGGAAAGAAGAGVAAGLRKIAPTLAESALSVRGTDRAYGRTPGKAILEETSGFSPGKIAQQASDKVDELSNNLEDIARDSPNAVTLLPARDAAEKSVNTAIGRNNPSTIKKMISMAKQLGEDYEGNEIPEVTTPQQLLHLKRGIGDLQTSWNPATAPKWVNGQVGHVYHALDSELDRALPEGAGLNQRISTLMPVAQRANAADLNAGFLQRTIGRFKAHTGALAAGAFGADAGYRAGGLPGAIIGGTGALLGTEAMASPETWIAAARAAHSPIMGRIVIPAMTGSGLQATRPKVFAEPEGR
jgi:hypothetical protein